MAPTPERNGSGEGGRAALVVALAGIVGVSFVGFAIGTGDTEPAGAPVAPGGAAAAAADPALEARPYLAMREHAPKAPEPATEAWVTLPVAPTGPDPGAFSATPDADWAAAVAGRAERRAYDGAPPVIPHPVDQIGVPTCLACHGFGKTVRGAVAVRPSHGPLSSCTQCHVTAVGPAPGEAPPGPALADNSFVGLQAPARGERAWPIAPAVTPHPTFMREQCDSCHGPSGREAIRTSHPWRHSCQQCHAPSAARDQAPML